MNFQSLGRPLSDAGLTTACTSLDVTAPEIWAVLAVETRAFGFLADRRPQLLFERHIFHQRTGGRFDQIDSNISNADAGGYASGTGEYARLDAAIALDRDAALASASWGIGQIMGCHFELAGYGSVGEMVDAMVTDEDSQLLAVARFIANAGLKSALQRREWAAFARGYNGPDYRANSYDSRLAAAYAGYSAHLPNLDVRAAQTALLYLGFDPGMVDGWAGTHTQGAVTGFQRRAGLPMSGALDDATLEALAAAAWP